MWWRCVGREKQRGPGRTGWSTKITVALGASLSAQSVTPCPPLTERSCTDLLARFAAVPDPRRPRGIRHQVQTILAIAAAAVVGGARSFAAIGEWAADAPQWVLAVLGARQDHMHGHLVAPHEATLRRTPGSFAAVSPRAGQPGGRACGPGGPPTPRAPTAGRLWPIPRSQQTSAPHPPRRPPRSPGSFVPGGVSRGGAADRVPQRSGPADPCTTARSMAGRA